LLFILINTGRGHLCVLAASVERFQIDVSLTIDC
jgi:hypothetical protein